MAITYTNMRLAVQSVIVDCNIDRDKYPSLSFITANGLCIYEFDENQTTECTDPTGNLDGSPVVDQLLPINWTYYTGFTTNALGETYTFSHLRVRANMYSGVNLTFSVAEIDDSSYTTLGSIDSTDGLTVDPKQRFTIPINKVAEQVSIGLSGSAKMQINSLTVFVSEKGKDYPR